MIWLFGGSIPLWMVFKHEAFVSIHCSSMQTTRPHTCCETSCQSKGCIFSKEIRKKLPSGKTNFPFASISTSWNFWRKALFLGDVPIAVCSLYIFPPICPSSTPPKKIDFLSVSTTWRGAPVNFVSMTSYFNLLASQTSFFLNHKQRCSTAAWRGRFSGGKQNGNFQGRWRTSENR